jgi:CoA-dependent NAD(P)H sulfur oxidoreductase
MNEQPKKLVVIGGVAGGTSAASRARRTDDNLDIVIYEKGPYVSYGACDEPYFVGGVVPTWENLLVRAPEEFENRQNIKVRLLHEVTSIDVENHFVEVTNLKTGESFTEPWDRLVISTGAAPRSLEIPGAKLPGVFQLKFLEQAKAIKTHIKAVQPQNAVILGAGFIAMEMAEALTENGIHVTICHRSSVPGGNIEPEIGEKIKEALKDHGVAYVPNCNVASIESGSDGSANAVKTDQGDFEAQLVLVAVGVRPEIALAKGAGVKLGPTGAIEVDNRQATNINGIFAAGDCCETINRVTGKPIHTPLGDLANKQGWTAGENAAGGDAHFHGSLASMHFKCFDLEVGMTGLTEREAEKLGINAISISITHSSRAHPQPGKKPILVKLVAEKSTGKLLGGQICGKEGAALRINSLATALFNEMTIERMTQLDFAYAPPFSPVIDPILLAARVFSKKFS